MVSERKAEVLLRAKRFAERTQGRRPTGESREAASRTTRASDSRGARSRPSRRACGAPQDERSASMSQMRFRKPNNRTPKMILRVAVFAFLSLGFLTAANAQYSEGSCGGAYRGRDGDSYPCSAK